MSDGPTCGSCLTLNPEGAPACVRCNAPLHVAPAGAGGTPAPAGAVGDPGADAPPETERPRRAGVDPRRALSPQEQRRLNRRIQIVGSVVIGVVVAVGALVIWLNRPRLLDTRSVADEIAGSLSTQLGGSVRVTCPGTVEDRSGVTFTCTVSGAPGGRRTVWVAVTGAGGTYRWQLR